MLALNWGPIATDAMTSDLPLMLRSIVACLAIQATIMVAGALLLQLEGGSNGAPAMTHNQPLMTP